MNLKEQKIQELELIIQDLNEAHGADSIDEYIEIVSAMRDYFDKELINAKRVKQEEE